jgi:hypothetical protein
VALLASDVNIVAIWRDKSLRILLPDRQQAPRVGTAPPPPPPEVAGPVIQDDIGLSFARFSQMQQRHRIGAGQRRSPRSHAEAGPAATGW